MPTRRSHGFPYAEPPRPAETNAVPAQAMCHEAAAMRTDQRTRRGQFAKGNRIGRTAKIRGRVRARDAANLSADARNLYRALVRETARVFGGGRCGVGSSLLLRWVAAKAELAERACDAGDVETFRKLSESARMDLIYAREHACREAEARAKTSDPCDPLAKWMPRSPTEGTSRKPAGLTLEQALAMSPEAYKAAHE